jgi:hypothetical protein
MWVLLVGVMLLTAPAVAQPTAGAQGGTVAAYVPITPAGRVDWVVQSAVSLSALGLGAAGSTWMTAENWPREWGRGGTGFGRRYLDSQGSAAVSSAIEAGLGMAWGEDPRYLRSGKQGIGTRLRYAVKSVVLAPRHDGQLGPAWGRLSGNLLGNAIENSWLPPSGRTRNQTLSRVGFAALDRLAGNLWAEFWPDARQRLRRHRAGHQATFRN